VSCHQEQLVHMRCERTTRSHPTMTRIKLLAATARLSVIIVTSVLAQVIQGQCAYAFHHANGNAGIESTPMRARDVTGIGREASGTSGAASASCAMAGNETASRPWSARHCQPHAADNPSSSSESTAQQFSTRKTRSSTARSKASAGAADAGGTKGPYFWCVLEDGEVSEPPPN
jgi:hypothetical protein